MVDPASQTTASCDPRASASWENVVANCQTDATALAVLRLANTVAAATPSEAAGERGVNGSVAAEEPPTPCEICPDPATVRASKRLLDGSTAGKPSPVPPQEESRPKRLCFRTRNAHVACDDAKLAAAISRIAA